MGKFLDEGYRLIRLVVQEQPLAERYFDITREFCDLEMMGSEFFEEELEPALKKLKIPYYSYDFDEDEETVFSVNTTDLLPADSTLSASETSTTSETPSASETKPEEAAVPISAKPSEIRVEVLEGLVKDLVEENRSMKARLDAIENVPGSKKVRSGRDPATIKTSAMFKKASPRKRKLPEARLSPTKSLLMTGSGSGTGMCLRGRAKATSGGPSSGLLSKKPKRI